MKPHKYTPEICGTKSKAIKIRCNETRGNEKEKNSSKVKEEDTFEVKLMMGFKDMVILLSFKGQTWLSTKQRGLVLSLTATYTRLIVYSGATGIAAVDTLHTI